MSSRIFFNGSTGSLGRYFLEAAKTAQADANPLKARLEDTAGLEHELTAALSGITEGTEVILLQLAAFVSVPGCEKEPERAQKTNVTDTVTTVSTFIRICRTHGMNPRVLFVSSGHIYAPKNGKILESDPVAPRSVYARTKLEAEEKLTKLSADMKTPLTIARVFGLVAPGQPPFYVLPSLFRRAKEKNLKDVPGLSNTRDYLDSRDVCAALVSLALHPPKEAVLNVCAGEAASIRSILEACLDFVRPDEAAELKKEITEAPGRPDDIAMIVGDASKIEKALGHSPKTIPIEKTIRDMASV